MVDFLVGLLIATVLVRVACELAPGLEIDGWGTAFAAAVAMRVAGFALGFFGGLAVGVPLIGMAFSVAVTVIVFAIAVAVLPGFRSEGASGIVVAGVIIALLNLGLSYAPAFIVSVL